MKGIEWDSARGQRFNILSDGKFHTEVPKETPGMIERPWESKDGKSKGVKYELVASSLEGKIANVRVIEGQYGDSICVTLDEGENKKDIYMLASSNFGEDFMKKLPNIKADLPVKFSPYSFEDEGKSRKGIKIMQGENKIFSFYTPKDGDTKIGINGYPTPAGDTSKYKTDDWKLFFLTARKFLLEEIKKSPFYSKQTFQAPGESATVYPDGPNPDEIPF